MNKYEQQKVETEPGAIHAKAKQVGVGDQKVSIPKRRLGYDKTTSSRPHDEGMSQDNVYLRSSCVKLVG